MLIMSPQDAVERASYRDSQAFRCFDCAYPTPLKKTTNAVRGGRKVYVCGCQMQPKYVIVSNDSLPVFSSEERSKAASIIFGEPDPTLSGPENPDITLMEAMSN